MNTTSNNFKKAERPLKAGLTRRRIIIAATVLIVFGYLLMSIPVDSEIFSPRKIIIAPMLCLAGYLLIIFGILRKDEIEPS